MWKVVFCFFRWWDWVLVIRFRRCLVCRESREVEWGFRVGERRERV